MAISEGIHRRPVVQRRLEMNISKDDKNAERDENSKTPRTISVVQEEEEGLKNMKRKEKEPIAPAASTTNSRRYSTAGPSSQSNATASRMKEPTQRNDGSDRKPRHSSRSSSKKRHHHQKQGSSAAASSRANTKLHRKLRQQQDRRRVEQPSQLDFAQQLSRQLSQLEQTFNEAQGTSASTSEAEPTAKKLATKPRGSGSSSPEAGTKNGYDADEDDSTGDTKKKRINSGHGGKVESSSKRSRHSS